MAKVPTIRGRVFKASGNWYVEVLSDGHPFPTPGTEAPWPTWRLAMLCANDAVRKRREYWARVTGDHHG